MSGCDLIANSHMGNKLTYTWPIYQFNNFNSQELIIWESPVFEHCLYHQSWLLRAAAGRSQPYFSLYLKLLSCDGYEIRLKFSILSPSSEKTILTKEKDFFVTQGKLCGFERFADITALRDQIYENRLTVVCELTISPDTKSFKLPECKMSEDLGNLFNSKILSDVTLAVDGYEIMAHKAILTARSIVFAAKFAHETDESKRDHVEIKDVDYKVLNEMLYFVYTDKAPNLRKMAVDLLVAADNYVLEKLKLMCEKELCDNLSIEAAADTLCLAERHNAKQLKVRTIDFINRHVSHVIETQGWKNMINTHSHLIAEVFQKFAIKELSKKK